MLVSWASSTRREAQPRRPRPFSARASHSPTFDRRPLVEQHQAAAARREQRASRRRADQSQTMQGEQQYQAEGSQPVYQAGAAARGHGHGRPAGAGGPLRHGGGHGAARADGARGPAREDARRERGRPRRRPWSSSSRPSSWSRASSSRGAGPGRPLARRQRVRLLRPPGRLPALLHRVLVPLRRGRPALAQNCGERRRRHRPGDPLRRVHRRLHRLEWIVDAILYQYRPGWIFRLLAGFVYLHYMLKIRQAAAREGGFQDHPVLCGIDGGNECCETYWCMPCIACFIMRHDIAAKQPGQTYRRACGAMLVGDGARPAGLVRVPSVSPPPPSRCGAAGAMVPCLW